MLDVKRIISIISEKGYNCSFIEKSLGFGNGAIRRWETSSPSINKLYILSNFLNIPIYALLTNEFSNREELTSDETEWLELYRKLDPSKQLEHRLELRGYIRANEENKTKVTEKTSWLFIPVEENK